MRKGGIFLFLFVLSVAAQVQIEVATDKKDYSSGEIIEISGKVSRDAKPLSEKFVSIEIRDSQDEVKYVSTKETNSQGEFRDSLVLPKSDSKSVYSLTASVESMRQTTTFKYGGGTTKKESSLVWIAGGLAFLVVILLLIIMALLSRQRKKEVKYTNRSERTEQLKRQIEEIEAKYGMTERSTKLRQKLEEMKK